MRRILWFISGLIACYSLSTTALFAQQNPETSSKFIAISDIHLNPFASCVNYSPCDVITTLEYIPASQWGYILEKFDKATAQGGQDSNYAVFKSTLAELKKAHHEQHPAFAVILGDSLAHQYEELFQRYASDKSEAAYQSFVKKTMTFISNEINHAFPEVDVYYSIGNNDSYVKDNVVDINGFFFRDMAETWSGTVKHKTNYDIIRNEMPTGGYYAVTLASDANLRLIVLNSVLFYTGASGKWIEQAASQELDWLHKELQGAANANQKVMIAMHVPPGINLFGSLKEHPFRYLPMFNEEITKRLQSELQQFAPQITLIMASHTHSDWFQRLSFGSHKIPLIYIPAVSPLFNNHPAYKVFSYNLNTLHINNIQTYALSIDKPSHEQKWDLAYDFNQVYQPDCTECDIINGMERLRPTGELAEHYKHIYGLGSEVLTPSDKVWTPYYYCQIDTIMPEDYQHCVADLTNRSA